MTPLFVYQNYHLVHHLHPSVPFYRYVRAWRRNEQAYLDRNAAISTWFGRSLTPSEYRTWRRLTDDLAPTPDGPSAQRPVFHPLRVAVGRAADRATARWSPSRCRPTWRTSTATSRASTSPCARSIDGADARRSYSIVSPGLGEHAADRRQADPRRRVLDATSNTAAPARRHPRRDDADRTLPHRARPPARAARTSPSRPAPGSPRCCRSSPPPWRSSRPAPSR